MPGNRKRIDMTKETDKITDYQEQYGGGTLPLSHTVASRELVRQVPFQKQRSPPLYSLRDFVPQAPYSGF